VWTYGFYDGWVPNYMFFVAHAKNAVGRFYEVQSYGPDIVENLRLGANATSREWYRPNPPLPSIKWGPRNNTNIQQSALLIALNYVARNRDTFLENYWIKNQRAVNRGKNEAPYAWVIPAAQRRKAEVADVVNALRRQGLEISRATSAFKAGNVDVAAGDYVIRADQPYRTMADMYFSLHNYAPGNPRPYDDTGWTMQLMRNIKLTPVADKGIQAQPMALVAADVKAQLDANFGSQRMAELSSNMYMTAGENVTISFGNIPAGSYPFNCTPHLAMGMKGVITVQ